LGRVLSSSVLKAVRLPESSTALLLLDSVSHSYGNGLIIKNLSLRLEKGRIACLLGPSGCGKTTVLRCIAGFEPITMGKIRLNGQPVSTPAARVPPEKRNVGMVFQDYALFPHLTVSGNVGFGLHSLPHRERERRISELLDTVGLHDCAGAYPHELSGGQQQRVALARALAPRPDLLLLDEPFSNLDVDLRERLSQEVRHILNRYGATAILVTHDQHEAFAMADEIGVLCAGEIQQWDTAYNLYHKPANRFVADFVGQGVLLPGKVLAHNHIQFELGTVKGSRTSSNLLPGTNIDVLVRPDDIIHDDSSPVHAEVLHKAFRGAEILYTLRLPGGGRALSLVPSHHNHALGEKIGIRLEIEHVITFTRPHSIPQ
jgi:iron(III) transport system ATP-binding protein